MLLGVGASKVSPSFGLSVASRIGALDCYTFTRDPQVSTTHLQKRKSPRAGVGAGGNCRTKRDWSLEVERLKGEADEAKIWYVSDVDRSQEI